LGLKPLLSHCNPYAPSWLNGLGSPFGFETSTTIPKPYSGLLAKWPVEPVWD